MPRLLVAMQVYLPLFSGCATWISSVPLSWITYGSPFLMLVCLSLNLNRKWKTSPRKAHQTSAPWNLCSESYHVMRGIGEPKEEQWSNAGLLAITWYTWLGGVSTRGGSAGGTRHIWKSAVSFYLKLCTFLKPYTELTKNTDKSVGYLVAKLVGCITLVDGTGAWLHVAENHRVFLHFAAVVFMSI